MGLKFLHLSDIHFQKIGENGHWDLDADLRNELNLDLENLAEKVGPLDAILISGDIAFSGNNDEYRLAQEWLTKICEITKCEEENILMVPGNHDVNWDAIHIMVRDAQSKFKEIGSKGDRNKLDEKIKEYCTGVARADLFKPLENYFAFAQRYKCVPESDSLYWEKNFSLQGCTLRIRGLNSALVSSKIDHEHTSKLIVGSIQSSLRREDGVIYLTMCHHPPKWLYDGDQVEEDLTARARVHLFGHKHEFRIDQRTNSVTLAAGAVHPERKEKNWDPRFNIIELDIIEEGQLKLGIWRRVWHKGDKKFAPDFGSKGEEMVTMMLELNSKEFDKALKDQEDQADGAIKNVNNIEVINAEKPNPLRKLAYDFYSIPYHRIIEIAVNLKLVRDSDKGKTEVERFQAYFRRTIDGKLEERLREEIDKQL